jgi:hypothetical protein
MADLFELWPAIGNIIAGDAVLTGGSSSSSGMLSGDDAVYYGDDLPKDLSIELPAIRMWEVGESPAIDATAIGNHEVRLQIDVFSDSPKTNGEIRKRLDDILNIPLKRPQGIETDNYIVRGMWRTGSVPLSLGQERPGGGAKLYQLATEWTIRVALKG